MMVEATLTESRNEALAALIEMFKEIASTINDGVEEIKELLEEERLHELDEYDFVRNVMFESTGLKSPTVQRDLVPL